MVGIVAIIIVVVLFMGEYFLFFNKSVSGNSITNLNSISKTTTKDTSEMVLQVSELPEGYVLKDRAPRTKSDINEIALNLGWQGGYYISFSKTDDNNFQITVIEERISKYPTENILKVLTEQQSNENMTVEKMNIEKIGDKSFAYKITGETDFSSYVGYYEIEFIKKNVYVDLTMSGNAKDFELLKELAQKVANKI